MLRSLIAATALTLAGVAHAETITVEGTDAIYGAGLTGAGVSTAPEVFSFTAGAGTFITASYLGGLVGCCGGSVGNVAADGAGGDSSVSALNGVSGITAPDQLFLAGVFVNSADLPMSGDTPPPSLNFIGNTDFASLSPLLNQAFWIGDGLTGTGAGDVQKFFAPVGADQLLLGFVDSFSFNGPPEFYGDNPGAMTVQITANVAPAIPLPAGLPLLLAGLGGLALLRRKTG